jgi:hypothetical protein
MHGEQSGQMGQTPECWAFDLQLADYLEGENRPQVLSHAGECPFCASLLGDLEKIRQASGERMVREAFEVDPPESMWPSLRAALIAEGIIHPPKSHVSRWFDSWQWMRRPVPVMAAVAAIACAVLLNTPAARINWRSGGSAPQVGRSSAGSLAFVDADPQLQDMVDQMERRFQAKMGSFDPSLRDAYVKSLASLDTEINECRRNAHSQPSNPLIIQYLSSAYAQKATVLQSVLETPAP